MANKQAIFLLFSIFVVAIRSLSQVQSTINHDPFMVLIGDHQVQPKTIPSTDVDTLISHLVGLLPLHPSSRDAFPHVSLFKQPKANVGFFFEGVGAEYFNNQELEGMSLKVFKNPKKFINIQQSFTSSSLSFLTTMVTGSNAKQHGILDRVWRDQNGELVEAYSSEATQPLRPNLADVILQTQEGKGLMFVAGVDKQEVSALSPHASLLKQFSAANSLSYYWNGEHFESLNADAPKNSFCICADEVLELFQKQGSVAFDDGGKIEYKDNSFIVTLPSNQEVTFDMRRKDEYLFFVELFAFPSFVQQLKESKTFQPLISDNIVDSYSFPFSSFKAFPSFHKNLAAVYLLDHAIFKILGIFQEMYGDRVASEVISLGTGYSSNAYSFSEKMAMADTTAAPTTAAPTTAAPTTPGNATTPPPSPSNDNDITVEDVAVYQTCLWTGILLFFAILFALYALVYMPIYADPLIFRQTFK